jgi:DtxR family Mn-dependent transcriptional regulator
MTISTRLEEYLEKLWMCEEEGGNIPSAFPLLRNDKNLNDMLNRLENEGQISLKPEQGAFEFTGTGREAAMNVIRRHRLAERLLVEVFDIPVERVEKGACAMEHARILNPAVTESVCTFLGHPPTCPHGKPIPPGECCRKFTLDVKPILCPLSSCDPGDTCHIAFISSKYHTRLDYLAALGIIPGSTIHLHQKKPTFLLQIGETQIALEASIAREIFVKRNS